MIVLAADPPHDLALAKSRLGVFLTVAQRRIVAHDLARKAADGPLDAVDRRALTLCAPGLPALVRLDRFAEVVAAYTAAVDCAENVDGFRHRTGVDLPSRDTAVEAVAVRLADAITALVGA